MCKGVLELLWEDISPSILLLTEAQKIKKNILLHNLKHGLDNPTITSVKNFNQLRSNNDILQHKISGMKQNHEDLDYNVRQKSKIKYIYVILRIFLCNILLNKIFSATTKEHKNQMFYS